MCHIGRCVCWLVDFSLPPPLSPSPLDTVLILCKLLCKSFHFTLTEAAVSYRLVRAFNIWERVYGIRVYATIAKHTRTYIPNKQTHPYSPTCILHTCYFCSVASHEKCAQKVLAIEINLSLRTFFGSQNNIFAFLLTDSLNTSIILNVTLFHFDVLLTTFFFYFLWIRIESFIICFSNGSRNENCKTKLKKNASSNQSWFFFARHNLILQNKWQYYHLYQKSKW